MTPEVAEHFIETAALARALADNLRVCMAGAETALEIFPNEGEEFERMAKQLQTECNDVINAIDTLLGSFAPPAPATTKEV